MLRLQLLRAAARASGSTRRGCPTGRTGRRARSPGEETHSRPIAAPVEVGAKLGGVEVRALDQGEVDRIEARRPDELERTVGVEQRDAESRCTS